MSKKISGIFLPVVNSLTNRTNEFIASLSSLYKLIIYQSVTFYKDMLLIFSLVYYKSLKFMCVLMVAFEN